LRNIDSIRSLFYKLARILGDISTVSKGKPGKDFSKPTGELSF